MPYWFYGFIVAAIAFGTWTMYHLIRSIPGQRKFANRVRMEIAIHDRHMERKYPGATARRATFNLSLDKEYRTLRNALVAYAIGVVAVIAVVLGSLVVTHGL